MLNLARSTFQSQLAFGYIHIQVSNKHSSLMEWKHI